MLFLEHGCISNRKVLILEKIVTSNVYFFLNCRDKIHSTPIFTLPACTSSLYGAKSLRFHRLLHNFVVSVTVTQYLMYSYKWTHSSRIVSLPKITFGEDFFWQWEICIKMKAVTLVLLTRNVSDTAGCNLTWSWVQKKYWEESST